MKEARSYQSPYDYKRTSSMSGPWRRRPPLWRGLLLRFALVVLVVGLLLAATAPR